MKHIITMLLYNDGKDSKSSCGEVVFPVIKRVLIISGRMRQLGEKKAMKADIAARNIARYEEDKAA